VASTAVVTGTPAATGGNPAVGTLTPASTASCLAGQKLLGGGATITQGSGAKGAIAVSQPTPTSGTPTGWTATGIVTISSGGTVTVTAYAICGA
jgi:hypothetical protein